MFGQFLSLSSIGDESDVRGGGGGLWRPEFEWKVSWLAPEQDWSDSCRPRPRPPSPTHPAYQTLSSENHIVRASPPPLTPGYGNHSPFVRICPSFFLHWYIPGYLVSSAFKQKPTSWTYNFVEVSGHNLESSQTWYFCMDFLNHWKGGKVFYQVFRLSPLQCNV